MSTTTQAPTATSASDTSATEAPGTDTFDVQVKSPKVITARDAAEVRRRELAAFLRSRRERLSPEEVGLPPGGRRRTPGLRREEVAQLAGVGITWYTWLEQARDIRVSEQVLEAISRTLLLDPHERTHLYTLAGAAAPTSEHEAKAIGPEVRAMLDQLSPFPAFVSNSRYDLLAYNHAYKAVIGDLDALPFEERNSLWLVFTKQTTSKCFVDREEARARMVAGLRAAMAEHVADPAWKCLIKRLEQASPDFRDLWQRHDVAALENARKRILHRDLGLLQFNYVNTWLAPRTGLRLVTYIPADEATIEATNTFEQLAPHPIT